MNDKIYTGEIQELMLKNAIRLLIAGYLFDGNDMDTIPTILKGVVYNYEQEIKKIEEDTQRAQS